MSEPHLDSSGACEDGHRHVFLPLSKLGACEVCHQSAEKTRLCSACGERIYCSPECQNKDWPDHKQHCGKTDRIELESFYPFLASLASFCHARPEVPLHLAVQHPIVNDVNPDDSWSTFPGGREAKHVLVDDRTPPDAETMAAHIMRWFPKAHSEYIARKLFYRITQEGYVLPIVTSVAVAILAEMYTTTSGAGTSHRRVRLKYKSSPIADFGIAKSVADVKAQDRLSYQRVSDGGIVHGQDSDDHYWLWFKTIRGEELELDFSMFVFNFNMVVPLKDYHLFPDSPNKMQFAPVFFRERDTRKHAPSLYKEKSRLSVLRDLDLHQAIVHSHKAIFEDDNEFIVCFMERMAGRKIQPIERQLSHIFTEMNCQFLGLNLLDRRWTKYPAKPAVSFYPDPGELDDLDDPNVPWAQSMQEHHHNRRRRS